MALFSGAKDFLVGDDSLDFAPTHRRPIGAVWMDTTEVTVGQIQKLMAEEKWQAPPLPFRAMGQEALANPDNPIVLASYDDAIALAEKLGKRLPTEFEYEFAATQGGRTRFPWGDDEQKIERWEFGPETTTAPWDLTATQPAVHGLYSNVLEWTIDLAKPYPTGPAARKVFDRFTDERIVRGGTSSILHGATLPTDWNRGPRTRVPLPRQSRESFSLRLGFRCVRSVDPS